MDGAKIGVFEQMYHERFGGFLERLYGLALPAQGIAVRGNEVKTDFTDLISVSTASTAPGDGGWGTYEAGEWEFEEEKVG